MSLIELIIELLFDVAALVLGIVLVVRTNDNQHRFCWGVLAISIGFLLAWENITWIFTLIRNPGYEYLEILNLEKMLKWFIPASIISFFPLASLRPGYLNRRRIILFLLPFTVILIITSCYLTSHETITKITSINEVGLNLGKFDVKLRLLIFLFSILIPLVFFVYPILINKTYRKISLNMYLFSGFIILLIGLYTLFTLSINTFFFNAFGITSVVFAITFSVLYLRSENPLSVHSGDVNKEVTLINKAFPLYFDIEKHFKENHSFIDSNYNMKVLAATLGEKEDTISDAIKSAGFTGFREYINYVRLEYFKVLASQNSQTTIKELIFACGFTSRTTFYRIFAEQYGISPAKYIDNQANNCILK